MASSPQALLSDAPNHCRNADHLAPPRPEEPSRARQRPGPRLDGRCWGCHKLGPAWRAASPHYRGWGNAGNFLAAPLCSEAKKPMFIITGTCSSWGSGGAQTPKDSAARRQLESGKAAAVYCGGRGGGGTGDGWSPTRSHSSKCEAFPQLRCSFVLQVVFLSASGSCSKR